MGCFVRSRGKRLDGRTVSLLNLLLLAKFGAVHRWEDFFQSTLLVEIVEAGQVEGIEEERSRALSLLSEVGEEDASPTPTTLQTSTAVLPELS